VKESLKGVLWRLALFVALCSVGIFALFAVFAQLRFGSQNSYDAEFTSVSGLKDGDFVRIAGVEVGQVKAISINAADDAVVRFSTDSSVVLTEGSRAIVRFENLIGDRFLELADGAGGTRRLPPGGMIPVANTQPALDLDALIGGFRPLFNALNPGQVNKLTGQLISVLQGQGGTIKSLLSQTSALTNTLADRDQLIGEVITNLNSVLGSLGDQNTHFGEAVDSISQLVKELSDRRDEVVNGVTYANAAAASVADLLTRARPPLKEAVAQTDRTAQAVLDNRDYFMRSLETLPKAYQIMGRQGLWGDFFSFYLCDLTLKVNGKGGQPVYIKLAGQDTGRCTPK
jgi:phospholipid/cholesterol/gamma-HCH transport system substrate-binding protein